MAQQHLNTLYVLTQDAYLRKDHKTLVVEVDGQKKLQVPGHHINSVVVFGRVLVSPGALEWASENEVIITYLSAKGRLKGRFAGPTSGNVLLRMDQAKATEDKELMTSLAKSFVAGKLKNCRSSIYRSARDQEKTTAESKLRDTAENFDKLINKLDQAKDVETVRGIEGQGGRIYFDVFDIMILREEFGFPERTRRPPRDPINAVLSFLYTLLCHDCRAAVDGVGLDPQVGFFHSLRPGRPSLALDLMEELRPVLADRLALTLFNRNQLNEENFNYRPGGSVQMDEDGLKTVIQAYQDKKDNEITHPFLDREITYGTLPHIQARLLARTIRGEVEVYPPYLYK